MTGACLCCGTRVVRRSATRLCTAPRRIAAAAAGWLPRAVRHPWLLSHLLDAGGGGVAAPTARPTQGRCGARWWRACTATRDACCATAMPARPCHRLPGGPGQAAAQGHRGHELLPPVSTTTRRLAPLAGVGSYLTLRLPLSELPSTAPGAGPFQRHAPAGGPWKGHPPHPPATRPVRKELLLPARPEATPPRTDRVASAIPLIVGLWGCVRRRGGAGTHTVAEQGDAMRGVEAEAV